MRDARSVAHHRLTWRGVIDVVAGRHCVQLDAARCPGCTGNCGMGLFAPPRIFLNADLGVPRGAPVEVWATAHRFAWRALSVFGTPLAVALAAATAVETLAWPDWLIVAAPIGAAAAMVGVRAALQRAERPPAVEKDAELIRVRID